MFRSPTLPRRAPKPRRDRRQQGLTIIEWMISTSIMIIAITSVLAMQSATIVAHKLSDEIIIANNIATQASEMLQIDALSWTNTVGVTKYFDVSVANVAGAQVWRPMTRTPINFQWTAKAENPSGTAIEQKTPGYRAFYCVYYAYRWAGLDSNAQRADVPGQPFGQNELLEVNISVVWPYSRRGLPTSSIGGLNLSTIHNGCGSSASTTELGTMLNSGTNQPAISRVLRQVRHTFYVRKDLNSSL